MPAQVKTEEAKAKATAKRKAARAKAQSLETVQCPHCGDGQSSVMDSRPAVALGVGALRRSRLCHVCLRRYFTLEVAEELFRSPLKK